MVVVFGSPEGEPKVFARRLVPLRPLPRIGRPGSQAACWGWSGSLYSGKAILFICRQSHSTSLRPAADCARWFRSLRWQSSMDLFERRLSHRSLLILSAVPIAVVANGFRITGTGVLGEYWGPEKAEGFFHLFSGLLIFLVSFSMLLFVHAAASRIDRRRIARHA